MNNIQMLIEKIRKEEREKILNKMACKEEPAWKTISDHVEEWGKDSQLFRWETNRIKNAIYTIIRFALDIDRMANLGEEQLDIALDIAESILSLI